MSDSKQDTRPIFLQKTVQLTALNSSLKGKTRHPMYPRIARRERRNILRIVCRLIFISAFFLTAAILGYGLNWAESQIQARQSERRSTVQLSIPALTGEDPLFGYIEGLARGNRPAGTNTSYKPGGNADPLNPNLPKIITKPIGSDPEESTAEQSLTQPIIASDQVNPSLSVASGSMRLMIPAIDVDHEIIDVPLVDGIWHVEELGQQIGRLEGTGRFPGDDLSMTLVAHATTTWPVWGPFQELERLPLGAEIILDVEGRSLRYQISRFRYVDPQATNAAFGENGNQLILITCGNYDFIRGEYQERLVAYADLVDG